jgi:hypothetical protein
LLDNHPQIVHYIGHGSGKQGLALEDDEGLTHLVATEALADLFALFRSELQCVVLNSCFSEAQAEVIHKDIAYVIGMRREIVDEAAIQFSVGFYAALFSGETIPRAFEFGRNSIRLESLPQDLKTLIPNRDLIPEHGTVGELLPEHLKPVLISQVLEQQHGDAGMTGLLSQMQKCKLPSYRRTAKYTVEEVVPGSHVRLTSPSRKGDSVLSWGDIRRVFQWRGRTENLTPKQVDEILGSPKNLAAISHPYNSE